MAPSSSITLSSSSSSSTSSSSSSSFVSSPASPLTLYPSSCASPPVLTDLSYYSFHPSDLPPYELNTAQSLSSLRDLAATSSAYNPLSLPISQSPPNTHSCDSINPSSSPTRPIPIPKRRVPAYDEQPIIPLTGRFDKGFYFSHIYPPPEWNKHNHTIHRRMHSRMRADHPTFRSPVTSPAMSPSRRPSSPQQSRRTQNPSKSVPTFHLENLPRFHPAVYQSSGGSQNHTSQPQSARSSRQSNYLPSSSSRQYRELVESVSKIPPGPLSRGPSAPRLGPLRSPGPVTPLALEESGGYLSAGAANSSEHSSRDKKQSGAGPDVVEMMVAREKERARQKAKVSAKGR